MHTARGRINQAARMGSSAIRNETQMFLHSRTDLKVSTDRTKHTVFIYVCLASRVTGAVFAEGNGQIA